MNPGGFDAGVSERNVLSLLNNIPERTTVIWRRSRHIPPWIKQKTVAGDYDSITFYKEEIIAYQQTCNDHMLLHVFHTELEGSHL